MREASRIQILSSKFARTLGTQQPSTGSRFREAIVRAKLSPRKDAIVKPGKEAKNSPFSSKTSHLSEKEARIYRGIPSDAGRTGATLLLVPAVPAPEKPRMGGRPQEFRRRSGYRRRIGSSGRRSSGFNHRRSAAFCDATASLRGSRAERPSSRASQAAGQLVGGFTEQRGHVKTGEYTSITPTGCLDTLRHSQSGRVL